MQKIHRKLDGLLQKRVTSCHPENPGLFAELKKKIPDLRTLNTLHSEKLLAYKMEPGRNGISGGLATSTSNGLDTNGHAAAWALNGHPSPNGSDWGGSDASKELNDVNYGSPRSVSSSVLSSGDDHSGGVKSPCPRSSSAASSIKSSSTNGMFDQEASRRRLSSSASTASTSTHIPITSCPLKRPGASSTISPVTANGKSSSVSSTNGSNHENGSSSGDESYGGKTSSSSSTSSSSKIRRVDSPTDSGIESGKEHCNGSTPTTSVCSSPRSALEEKVKDVTSDSESSEKHESIDDMPMLKRALQAPPLVNTNMLMDEAYRHHKKFRASKREGSSPSPSSSTSETGTGLASSHSTLVKTLEQAPRFLNEQQLKRTDLIHNIIMRTEGAAATSTSNSDVQLAHPLLHGRLSQYQGLSNGAGKGGVVMTPHGYYIPSSTSPSNNNGCPYSSSRGLVSTVSPRIMYTGSTSSPVGLQSLSSPSFQQQQEGLGGLLPMALQAQTRRSPLSSSSPLRGHSSPVSGLVMGVSSPPPTSHSHLQHHVIKSSPLLMSLTSPTLAINKLHHQSQSSDLLQPSYQDSQPLNLSMSKRASAPNSPTVATAVKMES